MAPPSGLDDYEGFFGLEEVDDVEVHRDHTSGQVTFTHAAPVKGVSAQPADDEWHGFSDNELKDKVSDDNLEDHPGNGFELLSDESLEDSVLDVEGWRNLHLSRDTLSSLSTLHFATPTPIQQSAIPLVLHGQDLIGKAPTGSGKTLAFGIPIFEKWLLRRQEHATTASKKHPIALILEPARELAHQIESHLSKLRHPGSNQLSIATLTGGLSLQKQKRILAHADIVVATPGRLWDIMSTDSSVYQSLKSIEILVVDEADRLLSQGHFQELEQVLTALDRQEETDENERNSRNEQAHSVRQTLVFSATLAAELQGKLAKLSKHSFSKETNSMGYLLQKLNFRQQPKFIDVNPESQMAANLTEALLEVSDPNKDLHLYSLLLLFQPHAAIRALVFVNSIAAVRRIVPLLQLLGFNALALHSNMEQKARLRSIERFSGMGRAGDPETSIKSISGGTGSTASSILVATDVAARGLDISDLNVVVHYHLPRAADMYIHRSGRTARASASGTSILMAGAKEAAGVKRLISQVRAEKPKISKRELRIITIEDRIVSQLRPRVELAKKIADVEQAKDKANGGDKVFQQAAEDLGVDLAELDELDDRKGLRGKKRKQKQADAQTVSKGELRGAKAELSSMLAQRIRMGGVSERYLANGIVDVGALMEEDKVNLGGLFLGSVEGLKLL